jgi:hypothetical protein
MGRDGERRVAGRARPKMPKNAQTGCAPIGERCAEIASNLPSRNPSPEPTTTDVTSPVRLLGFRLSYQGIIWLKTLDKGMKRRRHEGDLVVGFLINVNDPRLSVRPAQGEVHAKHVMPRGWVGTEGGSCV